MPSLRHDASGPGKTVFLLVPKQLDEVVVFVELRRISSIATGFLVHRDASLKQNIERRPGCGPVVRLHAGLNIHLADHCQIGCGKW